MINIDSSGTCCSLLKYNKARDRMHKQIHIHEGIWKLFGMRWSLQFFVIFYIPSQHLWFILSIWDISTPTFHKSYEIIQTLFIHYASNQKIAISMPLIAIVTSLLQVPCFWMTRFHTTSKITKIYHIGPFFNMLGQFVAIPPFSKRSALHYGESLLL